MTKDHLILSVCLSVCLFVGLFVCLTHNNERKLVGHRNINIITNYQWLPHRKCTVNLSHADVANSSAVGITLLDFIVLSLLAQRAHNNGSFLTHFSI